jgi:hypothetical protein
VPRHVPDEEKGEAQVGWRRAGTRTTNSNWINSSFRGHRRRNPESSLLWHRRF